MNSLNPEKTKDPQHHIKTARRFRGFRAVL